MNIIKKCKYGTMIINRRDSWVGDSLDIYGEFSESEVEVFRKYVQPGDFVLDIGANIGAHTIVFSQLVQDTGTVLAFEPERINYYSLCGNIAINNCYNTVAFQQAVGKAQGMIKVPLLDRTQTTNYGAVELTKDWSDSATYEVPAITIDTLTLSKCNFVKMDIEGMEQEALEGAVKTIAKLKPILYLEDDRPEKSDSLRKYVVSLGYTITVHRAPLFNKNNFGGQSHNIFGSVESHNILCLPN